ncbi:MAG: ABC transporter ATP-binding protein [Vallitaleaceae bacterium]|nr:ABC transporter ATP-binding protein [Vallitaleaceae bacterium]
MDLLMINGLEKKFNNIIAVDNMSFSVKEGEIFGLLGPNGAGKSTTIHAICGLIRTDGGEVLIDGLNMKKYPLEAKQRIGLVPQEIAIFDSLTARENLEFFGRLAGLRGDLLSKRVTEALEFVGLNDHEKKLPKAYSGGMKRRLNIACAIVHQPKLIIMDEPTVGIDPQSRIHILDSVRELNQLGSTIIYTSHYMEEVEAVCGEIAIMDHGRLIAKGTKDALKSMVGKEEKIVIEAEGIQSNCLEAIKAIEAVKGVHANGNRLEIITDSTQLILQDALFILSKNGVKIRKIDVIEPDFETVFLSLTGRTLRD